ncbi:hypothetical protein AAF712_012409 [Marasmius tenuissimus]|uniref:Uncharacterized protein n=1 Tax=Marasmius tenuissimus TaxID=585030 RepID=A0ABR2ZGM2_9AGAR
MVCATRNSRRKNLNAADEVPTTGEGAGELWAFLELGVEPEAKPDIKDEIEDEDEDERDPNDLVDKVARKQQFSRLFKNPHAELNASEWKKRNKNKCNKTRERKCSRLDDFRKESIMKKMGLNETLWEELMKDHIEDKGRKGTYRRKEMGRRVGEAENQETEEVDELDSDDEPQLNVTTVNGSEVGHGKRGRAVTDDGVSPLASTSDAPAAKKAKVEVVLNKINRRGRRGIYKPARADDLKSLPITNGHHDIATSKAGLGLPAMMIHSLPDMMTSTSTSLQPLADDFALPDLMETSPTPTPPPEATSDANLLCPPLAFPKASTPEINANISASTSRPENTVPVPPHRSIRQTQDIARIPNPPQPPHSRQPIPPELSLRVLKRALEDICSDLRYGRIDERSAMVEFDDVADRIGRRAALCTGSGADCA